MTVLFQLVKAVATKLEMCIPQALRAPGGIIREGTMQHKGRTLLIDQCHPTDWKMTERRPDLVVKLEKERRATIFEVAIAWEPLVKERTKQKQRKYQELAAELARQWPGYRVKVVPVVLGSMGLVTDLQKHLMKAELLNQEEVSTLMANNYAKRGALRGSEDHQTPHGYPLRNGPAGMNS